MSDGNHVIDLLPAYALDILTEEETTQVAEHLPSCSTCREELRLYQATLDELPLALAQVSPRPALKDRLLKEIRSHPEQASSPARPGLWQTWIGFLRRSYPAWSAALIILLALGNIFLFQRSQQNKKQTSSQTRLVALANTEASPNAMGTLVLNSSGEYGSLVVDGLPVLDELHQYQVWLKSGEERISGAVFSVNWEGYAAVEIAAPMPLVQYQSVGITIEPAGGSPGPTGAKVLGGDLQR